MRRIDLIVVHCSATREDQSYPVTKLISDHAKRFGFTGYHYYVTRDGEIYQTRNENLVGAHALHHNQHSIGVCYEGGLDQRTKPADTRTAKQREVLWRLLQSLKRKYPGATILGHRDLPGVKKKCPCFDARTEYALL